MSLGIREYARHRKAAGLPGGTSRAVEVAIKSGRLAKSLTKDGKIRSAKAADLEWAAATHADMVPLTGPTAPASSTAPPADAEAPPVNELAAARTRREASRAELAEIQLAEKRGELVRVRDVEARLADVFLRCRTQLMGIPSRLREQDPTLSPRQVQLVDSLIRETLKELAG